jgi:hypothetical protein
MLKEPPKIIPMNIVKRRTRLIDEYIEYWSVALTNPEDDKYFDYHYGSDFNSFYTSTIMHATSHLRIGGYVAWDEMIDGVKSYVDIAWKDKLYSLYMDFVNRNHTQIKLSI